MDPRCHETREMAADLALGIVEGEERGRALQHLADCPDCRAEVEKYSDLADELLLLTPHREPPVGFESRVLDEILPAPQPKRRRRFRLVLAPAAAALASVAIVLAIVAPDLRLASHYRHTLDQANGKEFESYALRAGDTHVGTIFSYEGSPSWVHVDVDAGHRAGLTDAELVTDDGSQVPLRWFHLDSSGGSGGSIPVDPKQVSVLRLTGAPGQPPLIAHFSD
jgi:anti-sigma-K factor RskA